MQDPSSFASFRTADSSQAPSREFRQNLITRQWVAVAPGRTDRPHDFGDPDGDPDGGADSDADGHADDASGGSSPVDGCPFCPGHTAELPSIIWEQNGMADGPASWQTRVVPNKFPALTSADDGREQSAGLYRARPAFGRQEVVIDTPLHHQPWSDMPVAQVEAVLRTYRRRYRALRDEGLIPFVFRNHRSAAGASLAHPHSQIIATDLRPPQIEREERRARAHTAETGRCAYCQMLADEQAAGVRVVRETDAFLAFVPYAATVPYEVWVLPREHAPDVGTADDATLAALAETLQDVLAALSAQCSAPPYNLYIRTALDGVETAPHLHWSVRIQPRLSVDAGFELGTGVKINPSLPARDAEHLRAA